MFEIKINNIKIGPPAKEYSVILDLNKKLGEYSDLPFEKQNMNYDDWMDQCKSVYKNYKECTTLFVWEE